MKRLQFKRKNSIEERLVDDVNKEVREVKREWRHFLKFKDENHILFVAFVIVVASALVINTIYIVDSTTKRFAKLSSPTDSSKVLTSLQTGSNDALSVKVSNVTENNTKDYAFTIDPAETMLILDIAITNKTAATQSLIPVNQLYVRTSEGDTIALHASMYVTKPLSATELAAGKTATGQLSFNVPKKFAHPLLYVDTGWGKNVPLIFDVLQ